MVIAKLDRLSRSASFTLALRDSGAKFVCCDMPEANDLTIGVLAVANQHEAQAISTRTKDALKAAKARGVRLGNPNGAAALKRAGKGNQAAIGKHRPTQTNAPTTSPESYRISARVVESLLTP